MMSRHGQVLIVELGIPNRHQRPEWRRLSTLAVLRSVDDARALHTKRIEDVPRARACAGSMGCRAYGSVYLVDILPYEIQQPVCSHNRISVEIMMLQGLNRPACS